MRTRYGHFHRLHNKIFNAFENKFLGKNFGPLLVNGQWKNVYINEDYKLYNDKELNKDIRLRNLQWLGHVVRMENETMAQEIT